MLRIRILYCWHRDELLPIFRSGDLSEDTTWYGTRVVFRGFRGDGGGPHGKRTWHAREPIVPIVFVENLHPAQCHTHNNRRHNGLYICVYIRHNIHNILYVYIYFYYIGTYMCAQGVPRKLSISHWCTAKWK